MGTGAPAIGQGSSPWVGVAVSGICTSAHGKPLLWLQMRTRVSGASVPRPQEARQAMAERVSRILSGAQFCRPLRRRHQPEGTAWSGSAHCRALLSPPLNSSGLSTQAPVLSPATPPRDPHRLSPFLDPDTGPGAVCAPWSRPFCGGHPQLFQLCPEGRDGP